jgi:hypothetical protein
MADSIEQDAAMHGLQLPLQLLLEVQLISMFVHGHQYDLLPHQVFL